MSFPDDRSLDPTVTAACKQEAAGSGPDAGDTTVAAGSVADTTTPQIAVPPADAPTIPGYEITGEIAKGGMGRVYAARDLTLAREVAIKTLLPGANAERFVTEARITARLPHPGIPPVHALGTLTDGMPYLAMKLIRGQTLAELLQHRSSPDEKLPRQLDIFEQIAQAVGFAHTRGIIHRDLKPLNVMVGEFGEVQVMDWGLAKDQAAPDRAPIETTRTPEEVELTADGAIMGTPGYMAPEQARGEVVDARADVFALGSMLAVLLTGRPAFVGSSPRETIARAASADLSEILSRLNGSGADAELLALAKSCLAADVTQRPADARAVAAAVADYRAGVEQRLRAAETEAAEAQVREAEQRKRRRAMQMAAGAIVAVLLLGIAGTSLGLVVANRQRIAADRAAEKARLASLDAQAKEKLAVAAAEKERIATELTAERLRQIELINNTIFDIFTEFDIRQVKQGTEPVEYVLAQKLIEAGKKLDAKAIHDPLVLARMQNRLGITLLNLGEAPAAIGLLTNARATFEDQVGPEHPDTLNCIGNLASAYKDTGNLDLALPLYEQTLQLKMAKLGPDHPDTLTSVNNLANGYAAAGKFDLALPLYEETLKLRKTKFGPDSPDTLTSMNNLAHGYAVAGKLDLALPLFEESLQLIKGKLGPDHPHTLMSMNNLASIYLDAGKFDLALPLCKETLQLCRSILGPDHPDTLTSMSTLASTYRDTGKFELALPLYEETLKLRKARLGPDHPDTLASMNNLAEGYRITGKLDLALPLYEATLQMRTARLGPDHPDTLTSMNNLAEGYRHTGKLDLALPLFEATLQMRKARLGPDHPDTLTSMNNLAEGYRHTGKLDLALPLYEATLQLSKARLGPDHPDTLTCMNNLASGYHAVQEFDLALPLMEESLQLLQGKLGPHHPTTLTFMSNLAICYRDSGKLELALPLLEQTLRLRQANLGRDAPDTLTSMNNLAGVYRATERLDLALPLYDEMLQIMKGKLGPDHIHTLKTMNNLAIVYQAAGELGLALPLYEELLELMRTKFGPDHSDTRAIMNNLAAVYWRGKQLNKSIPLFEEILRFQQSKLGEDHLDTIFTAANLGVNYRDAGRVAEAIPLLEAAYRASSRHRPLAWVAVPLLDAYAQTEESAKGAALANELLVAARQGLPPDSPQLAGELASTGRILLQLKAWADAEPIIRECLEIRQRAEPEAWSTFNAQAMLGATLLGQEKFAEAEPLLLAGYEGMKTRAETIPPQGQPRLTEALDRLIELHTATNRADDAAKWQAERATYEPAEPPEPEK